MTIPANATVPYLGTPATVLTTTGATVADGAFTSEANAATGAWANTQDAPMAIIRLAGAMTAAPAVGSCIEVHVRKMDINGTADEPKPSANWLGGYRHSIPLNAGATAQNIERTITLPAAGITGQTYEFYLKVVGSATSLAVGATLTVTPFAYGPKA